MQGDRIIEGTKRKYRQRTEMTLDMNDLDNSLVSLAILKTQIDKGLNSYEYIGELITNSIDDYNVPFDENEASEAINKKFSLLIPPPVVKLSISGMIKSKKIKRKNKKYVFLIQFPDHDLKKEIGNNTIKIKQLTTELHEFTKTSSNTLITLTKQEALDALILFISKFSVPCMGLISDSTNTTILPDVKDEKNIKIKIVSSFIKNKLLHNIELFEYFSLLVTANIFANSMFCNDLNKENVKNNFKNVTFYVDTPLLFKTIGLEGSLEEESMKTLFSLIKKLNGNIKCFSHSIEEAQITIETAAKNINNPKAEGSIIWEAKKQKLEKSDLILKSKELTTTLSNYMGIVQTPSYKDTKYQINEPELQEIIERFIKYKNPKALLNDINSIRCIFSERKDTYRDKISECKCIFVTQNHALVKAAKIYQIDIEQKSEKSIPPAITYFDLINIAWVKIPLEKPHLPQEQILALASSITKPDDKFIKKVFEQAQNLQSKGLITEESYGLLKTYETLERLNDVSAGQEDLITDEVLKKDEVVNPYKYKNKAMMNFIREQEKKEAKREATIGLILKLIIPILVLLILTTVTFYKKILDILFCINKINSYILPGIIAMLAYCARYCVKLFKIDLKKLFLFYPKKIKQNYRAKILKRNQKIEI